MPFKNQLLLLATSLTLLCGCSPMTTTQNVSLTPINGGNESILTDSEIVSAFHEGDPIECIFESTKNNGRVEARIQGNKALLSAVDFGDGVPTGMVLFTDSQVFGWKDGSTFGWKAIVPAQVTLAEITHRSHTQGLGVADMTTIDSLRESRVMGDQVSCVRSQFSAETFSQRDSVVFRDVSPVVDHFFR